MTDFGERFADQAALIGGKLAAQPGAIDLADEERLEGIPQGAAGDYREQSEHLDLLRPLV